MRYVKLTTKYGTPFSCICGTKIFKATVDEDGTSERYNCIKCNMHCGFNKLRNHASKMFGNYTYATEVEHKENNNG